MPYRLLDAFEHLFSGQPYKHRIANQGDLVAIQLYEDLLELNRSSKFRLCVGRAECVVNTANRRKGIAARRGDGTLGDLVPGLQSTVSEGFSVPRGPVANVHVGVEVKILLKAMIKQIDRVVGDLNKQVVEFKRGGSSAICVGIVGVNYADYTVGYEGDRAYRTDGAGKYRHPIQEAAEAEKRLISQAAPNYDELIILRFRARNDPPYVFEWVDQSETEASYSSALVRISREYDRRF